MSFNDFVGSHVENAAKARAAASKAVELDPGLAEARISMGQVLAMFDWDFRGAESEFRRGLEISPNNSAGLQWYGELLMDLGRYDDGLATVRRAREADPFSLIINAVYGETLSHSGRVREAREQFQKTLDLDSNFAFGHFLFGLALLRTQALDEATRELERALQLSPDVPVFRATLGYVHARNAKIEEARGILSELIQAAKSDRASWLDVAGVYAGLGEKDHAFAALDLALEHRDSRMTMLFNIETLEPLHSDPRFADLLKKVGLPP